MYANCNIILVYVFSIRLLLFIFFILSLWRDGVPRIPLKYSFSLTCVYTFLLLFGSVSVCQVCRYSFGIQYYPITIILIFHLGSVTVPSVPIDYSVYHFYFSFWVCHSCPKYVNCNLFLVFSVLSIRPTIILIFLFWVCDSTK